MSTSPSPDASQATRTEPLPVAMLWVAEAERMQRLCLLLHLLLEMDHHDIAIRLGCSPQAVAYLLGPALDEVRRPPSPCPAAVAALDRGREPGWYRHPEDPLRHRYWDGAAWTRSSPPVERDRDPHSETGRVVTHAEGGCG